MKRSFLTDLGLDDTAVIDKIMAENGRDIQNARESEKQETDRVKAELDALKADRQQDGQNAKTAEALQQEVDTAKAKLEELQNAHAEELAAIKLDHEIDQALTTAGARNPVTVKALLAMDKVKFDENGELTGLADQLETIKGQDGYLFNETADAADKDPKTEAKKQPKFQGIKPGESGRDQAEGDGVMTKEDFLKLPYTERNKLYLEDRETYDQLME